MKGAAHCLRTQKGQTYVTFNGVEGSFSSDDDFAVLRNTPPRIDVLPRPQLHCALHVFTHTPCVALVSNERHVGASSFAANSLRCCDSDLSNLVNFVRLNVGPNDAEFAHGVPRWLSVVSQPWATLCERAWTWVGTSSHSCMVREEELEV